MSSRVCVCVCTYVRVCVSVYVCLKHILSRLNLKFDILGICEHKICKDTLPSNNISIPGKGEFIFEPPETTHAGAGFETSHAGTGFYIKDNIYIFYAFFCPGTMTTHADVYHTQQ